MNTLRVLGMTLFVVGIVLLLCGIAATQKVGERIMGQMTGHFTELTMWYIFGGLVLIIGGAWVRQIKR